MTTYRRNFVAGGSDFFTVNLAERRLRLLTDNIPLLRTAFRYARRRHPFVIDAIVVLPDQLHAIWTLPAGDGGFSVRWRLIQAGFFPRVAPKRGISVSRLRKHERGIWRRRYWEHMLRDEDDFARHLDYVHFNPSNTAMGSALGLGHFHRSIAWCGSASTPRPGRTRPRIGRTGSASGDGFRSAQPILRAAERA